MAVVTREMRGRFSRVLHQNLDLTQFFDAADQALVRLVPYDESCWLSFDPATLMPTSHFSLYDAALLMALAANEFLEDDVNKFAELARASVPAATLMQSTNNQPGASPRHNNFLVPLGYGDGDELRAVFRDGDIVWGGVAIHRRTGRFSDGDVVLVASLGADLAQGIRRAILRTSMAVTEEPDPPGLILLGPDDSVERLTPAATRWLDELVDSTKETTDVPLVAMSVAHRARQAARGESEEMATIRLPMRSGGWLRLDGSLLDGDADGRVAVIISPAREPEIAPLVADAYGLSRRESEVTRLVLSGRSTQEIADSLGVSPYTVQDHLKSVFDKVGVRSRRELVAQMFMQHCAPRLQAGAAIAADGWFAPVQRP